MCRPFFIDRPHSGTQNSAGFTIIEVVVAARIFMVVASSIGFATISNNQLQGSAKAKIALTSTSKRVIDSFTENRGWMGTAGETLSCK